MRFVQTLSGLWKLGKDPGNVGRDERWFDGVRPDAADAEVPSVIQQVYPEYHGVAWYWHTFRIRCDHGPDRRLLLRFGAVDYLADVWVNGVHLGSFEGGETPFAFDVTDVVRPDEDNLLAVRALNPTDVPIDGYALVETPHANKTMTPRAGSSFNYGGIVYPVELRSVPEVHIADLFVEPDPKTGRVDITAWVQNAGNVEAHGTVALRIAVASAEGDVLVADERKASFPPGESVHKHSLRVAEPRLWQLDDPYLYRATCEVTAQGTHEKSVRFGFRDFRVVDGYFHLNGKRIFLKSSHTGNHMPIGLHVPVVSDFVRRDAINAKASGFNTMRFIAGTAYPEQLDFCDEIGMLVIEETFASWLLGGVLVRDADTPQETIERLRARYEHNYDEIIRRDRNHPCIVAWQLLNETHDGPIVDIAHAYLPKLRERDRTRLVLFSSGRWDNRFNIGSVSNPGSGVWEHVWGAEGDDAPDVKDLPRYPSHVGAGIFHLYPEVPHRPEVNAFIRNLGRDSKPVFLGEYGIGSLYDVMGELRHYEQVGARPDLEDMKWLREQSDALRADWERLGLENVYPFPEDMLRESQRLNARQRTMGFDLIRSNPKLCGFNLTGMLDHAMCGEGVWKFWREFKPEMFDAMWDGWSPLRWCLFVDPIHAYVGREIAVEAVLATEDALSPGTYPAGFRLFGPEGAVWKRSAEVEIVEPLELAVPVFRESVRLEGPPGRYTFAANLHEGGAATGGRLVFHAADPAAMPPLSGAAVLWGIDSRTETWLSARGLRSLAIDADGAAGAGLILVGEPQDWASPQRWRWLNERMDAGATVVFVSAKPFVDDAEALGRLPLKSQGRCRRVHDWLYHKECVANRHPVFAGLQGPGVLDMEYYGPVIPHEVFEELDTPDETICAGFFTGYHAIPRGYASNLIIASYRSGKGRFFLNAMHLLENLDRHPAADRLLINLVRYAAGEV